MSQPSSCLGVIEKKIFDKIVCLHNFTANLTRQRINMNFQETTEKVKAMAANTGGLGSSIKFATDEGPIFLGADGTVSNDDAEADCTVSVSFNDLKALMAGDLNPMSAFMFGKIKVSGDMGVAMKLQSLFS